MKDFARSGSAFAAVAVIALLSFVGCSRSYTPASLTVNPSTEVYAAHVGDPAYTVSISSARLDGVPVDFTVVSDTPAVVSVTKGVTSGYVTPVTLTPLAEGQATITFTSASSPVLTATIKATISAKTMATLTLSPSSNTYAANLGDVPYVVNVTALKRDGTADDFSVASNSSAVSVSKGTTTGSVTPVTLTPLAEGTATIMFTSASDLTLTRTISATISPKLVPVLSVSPSGSYTSKVGDTHVISVTATKGDGTADTFNITSSNSKIVDYEIVGKTGSTTSVNLKSMGEGQATVTFTSDSDTSVQKTVAATVEYADPVATYSLSSKVYPVPASTIAYPEDKLQITFDSTPILGSVGTIRIFKAADDTLVDCIQLANESDTIGVSGSVRRGVVTTPIQINGNVVTITPHSGKLVSSSQYYVGISSTVFSGATLSGKTFEGIGKAAGWVFTVKSTTPATGLSSVTVAPMTDTTADFHSVQAALNYYMTNSSVSNPVINVKNGTYNELLYLYNRPNLTILGESRAGVIIQYNNYESLNSGSGAGETGVPTNGGGRSVFLVDNSDMLTLDTLTLKNTHVRNSQYSNHAEVLCFKSTTASLSSGHRLVAKNANFYSEQTTLQLQGYTWFYNTKISGNINFIWGNNYTSLFEASTIEMLGDSMYPATVSGYSNGAGGNIVQARTYPGGKGFIFAGDILTYADGPSGVHVATETNASSYLAKAASGTWVDNVVYLNCKVDTHIAALGWAVGISGNPAPNPATPTAISGWREYGSMDMSGTPLSVSGRSTNSKQLTSSDVSSAAIGDFTQSGLYPTDTDRATVFSAIGWAPVP